MTILHLKERVKEHDINRVINTKGGDQNKVFRHGRTCRTLEKSKGVGREVREKELMLAIDKTESSPMITLSEAVYDS